MEHRIAKFMGKEAALLFSTGFQAGQGVIAPLMARGEHILSDRDNHASIVAGNMLASSINIKVVRYKHNDLEDIERRLKSNSTRRKQDHCHRRCILHLWYRSPLG